MPDETTEPLELTPREIALAKGDLNQFGVLSPVEDDQAEELETAEDQVEQPEVDEAEVAEDSTEETAEDQAEDSTDTPVVQEEVASDSEDSSESEGAAPAPDPTAWIDPIITRQAASYGISQDELARFSGPEEFGKTVDLLNRLEARKPKPEPEKPEEAEAETPEEVQFDPEEFKEYDEPVYKMAQAFKQQQEELKGLKQTYHEAQEQAAMQEYRRQEAMWHDALDSRNPEFYGESLKENRPQNISNQEAGRRQRLYEVALKTSEMLAEQAQQYGTPMPTLDEVLDAAEAIAFPTLKQQREQQAQRQAEPQAEPTPQPDRTTALRAQSRRRRPAGNTRTPPPMAPADRELTTEEMANDPDIMAAWDHYARENG